MGKLLNKKGVKYAADKMCYACNLIIKGNAFYCFTARIIFTQLVLVSRETKLLYFVTNRNFSCFPCIKKKEKYGEAVIWLKKLEESVNEEQDLLHYREICPAPTTLFPLNPQNPDLFVHPSDAPSTL